MIIKAFDEANQELTNEIEERNALARKHALRMFQEITGILMDKYPVSESESPEEAVGLMVAIGAAFEMFMILGKNTGKIDENSEATLRHNATALAEAVINRDDPKN